MAKLTPWFPPRVKPTRNGVYEREGLGYSHWDGRQWMLTEGTPALAARQSHGVASGFVTGFAWRGLAQQPKEKA